MQSTVQSFGKPDLLNEFVFHNYSQSIAYFDDDLEKTALYLDVVSRNENITSYIKSSQNYELYSAQYLPCYAFKRFCAGTRAINRKSEFPKELRNMYFEEKKWEAIQGRLLDLQITGRKGFKKVKASSDEDDERFKLSKNSSIQNGMTKKAFKRDLLPYIFLMVHPSIREINTQLFT